MDVDVKVRALVFPCCSGERKLHYLNLLLLFRMLLVQISYLILCLLKFKFFFVLGQIYIIDLHYAIRAGETTTKLSLFQSVI